MNFIKIDIKTQIQIKARYIKFRFSYTDAKFTIWMAGLANTTLGTACVSL